MKKVTLSSAEESLIMCLRETGFEVKTLLELVKENMGKTHSTLTKKLSSEKDSFMVQILQGVVTTFEKNYKTVEGHLSNLE